MDVSFSAKNEGKKENRVLQGLLKVIFFYSGKGLVALGYGREGMAAREKLGKSSTGLALLFGCLVFVWLFVGAFYFMDKNTGSLVTIIVCPVIYAVWFFFARKSSAKLIEESKAIEPEEDLSGGVPQGGWRCHCGRVHPGYESSCVCGKSKSECK